MGLNKKIREDVYKKYNGCCAYCGEEIKYKDMQVDHILSKAKGGLNEISNYNPSCRSCNHYKRTLDLDGFREYMETLHKRISNDYITKIGIRYGIVVLKPFDGKFYFEKSIFEEESAEWR